MRINDLDRAHTRTVRKTRNPLWNDDFYLNLNNDFRDMSLVLRCEKRGGTCATAQTWRRPRRRGARTSSRLHRLTAATSSRAAHACVSGAAPMETGDKAIGVASISRDMLSSDQKQHEQWYAIEPARDEGQVSGQIVLEIKYTSGDKSDHLAVRVVSASGLMRMDNNGLSDPYVTLHLLPDMHMKTTQKTRVQKGTLDPVFEELFNFSIPKTGSQCKYQALHVAVWDWDRFSRDDFMGQVIVSLSELRSRSDWDVVKVREIFPLRPMIVIDPMAELRVRCEHRFAIHNYKSPTWCMACDGLLYGIVRQGLKCKDCSYNTHEKCRSQFPANCRGDKFRRFRTRFGLSVKLSTPQRYVVEVQDEILEQVSSGSVRESAISSHAFEAKTFKQSANCGQCYGKINDETGFVCKTCGLGCHARCKEMIPNSCGSVGQLRLKYRYTEEAVLAAATYAPLMDMLTENDHYLLWLLQAATAQREECARSLVRVFEHRGEIIRLLETIARREVLSTSDPNTIFRGNSLVTKAWDVFLKLHGSEYLRSALLPVIRGIFEETATCELDPTRFGRRDNVERNLKALRKHVTATLDAIFGSASQCPFVFRTIFHYLREQVAQKFPDDATVRYTAISGFLFLRFFCPAILGPQLFDLVDGLPPPRTARILTLVAKTLQAGCRQRCRRADS